MSTSSLYKPHGFLITTEHTFQEIQQQQLEFGEHLSPPPAPPKSLPPDPIDLLDIDFVYQAIASGYSRRDAQTIFSHLNFLCRYSERHSLRLTSGYVQNNITTIVLNCLDQSAPLDLVTRVLYFITVICRRDSAISREFTSHIAIEKVLGIMEFLPQSHFSSHFECLFEISCVCDSVFCHVSFDTLSRFATSFPGILSFWRFVRRMCSRKFTTAEFGAFLMNCIASAWANCEDSIQIEMLWIISALSAVIREKWDTILVELGLQLFISNGLLSRNKELATASVICFARIICFLRPMDSHLLGLIELLKREEFLDVGSFGILEVLTIYRDAAAFFLEHGILEEMFSVFMKCKFEAKCECLLVLCGLVTVGVNAYFERFWGKPVLEVFLEYLETGVSAEITTHICRALLAFAKAADIAGKRIEFMKRFGDADGTAVLSNIGNICGVNNTGQGLVEKLIEWYEGN